MELKTTPISTGLIVVSLPEEHLDAGNARSFKQSIHALLEQYDKVVFDMSSLSFVDSSGLGALISCLRAVSGRRGDFKLCGLTKPVRALFELMRMHRVFNIYNTQDDAVRAFS